MARATLRNTLLALCLSPLAAYAAEDLTNEMDALGANQDLVKKARAVDPDNRVRVVQNRDVDRNNRVEVGVNASLLTGGDSYVNTTSLGLNLDYHFNPHWSLGLHYSNYGNTLSSEGKNVFNNADATRQSNPSYVIPKVDYAKDSYLAIINWYPLYGKINLFDRGIAQFDIYLLGGGGTITLGSGSSAVYTVGAGAGFWWTQHFTSRVEARWQGYKDLGGSRAINETVLGLSLGYLF